MVCLDIHLPGGGPFAGMEDHALLTKSVDRTLCIALSGVIGVREYLHPRKNVLRASRQIYFPTEPTVCSSAGMLYLQHA